MDLIKSRQAFKTMDYILDIALLQRHLRNTFLG